MSKQVEELQDIAMRVCHLDVDHSGAIWRDSQDMMSFAPAAAGRVQDMLNTLGNLAADARQALGEEEV